jgi:hypothetical protein
MRMAGSGFRAATIPMQNSLITIITIPVQADIMAVDLTVADIMAAVLMVVVADMAGINSCNLCLKTSRLGLEMGVFSQLSGLVGRGQTLLFGQC